MAAQLPPRASAPITAVFSDLSAARRATNELRVAGFQDRHLGLIGAHRAGDDLDALDLETHTKAAEGAAAGVAAGAGLGALGALAVAAGVIPLVGPAIAGGLLASAIAGAAGGAVVGGLIGALVGLGIPEDEARFLEMELQAGRALVTVQTSEHRSEAQEILARHGGQLRELPRDPNRIRDDAISLSGHDSAATMALEGAGLIEERPSALNAAHTLPAGASHVTSDLSHAELDAKSRR